MSTLVDAVTDAARQKSTDELLAVFADGVRLGGQGALPFMWEDVMTAATTALAERGVPLRLPEQAGERS